MVDGHEMVTTKFVDAAELAKAIRDELVTWDGAESGSRQMGWSAYSVIDIRTDDGITFKITVEGPPLDSEA